MLKRQSTENEKESGSPVTATANPDRKRTIEALSYQLWLQRGCPIGSDQEDWFEAEKELRTAQSLAA